MKNTNTMERGNEMAFDKAKYDLEHRRENYDQLRILLPKGAKDPLKAMAERQGKTMAKFVRDALYHYMDAIGENRIDIG